MKWFRIMLATFLLVGMLLGISSVAYAADPEDPDLKVDVTIVGDNADVGVDIFGDNAEVWINGQNLNDPTVIHQGGGVEASWVKGRINEALAPLLLWMNEYGYRVDLSAEGLAKVILLAQDSESQLEAQITLVSDQEARLTTLETEVASLSEQVNTLEAQNKALMIGQYDIVVSYNRVLAIIIGVFSVIVIGLAISLVLLWRRTRR